MQFYNKHYIRVDAQNYIVKGFSDAFEEPLETDICINQEDGRQFELLGQVNPSLINKDGSHLYKYLDGEVIETTEAERTAEIEQTQLQSWKSAKIVESKTKLEEYLANNPYLFVDGKHYSVTKDKQNLLANAISVYQIKTQAGEISPIIKWNARGEECTEWAIENIIALAVGISNYVTPLVSKQQSIELQINSCTTKTELESVVIDYAIVA